MSNTPLSSASARNAAIAWLVRRDAGSLSSAEAAEFDTWRTEPANAAAYDRASRVWTEMGLAATGRGQARTSVSHGPAKMRGRHRVTAGALLAASLVMVCFGPGAWISMTADSQTHVGEVRRVALPDGSSVTLDTGSAMTFHFGSGLRAVRLLRGAAVFHVAADPRRPFIVEAAGGSTRALGTIFLVRRQDGGAVVTGIEHRIAVTLPTGRPHPVYALGPGQTLSYGRDLTQAGPSPAAQDSDAFERGELVFDDRPLAAVVAELNRYRLGKILLVGDVGAMTVSGVFRTDDPAGALAALQTRLGLNGVAIGDALTILYK